MNDPTSQAASRFVEPLIEKLKRHPKRVVFTDGEDVRVLRVAARLVAEEAIVPILLGRRERVHDMAAQAGISMQFIKVINPPEASDFDLFCRRLEKIERYRSRSFSEVGSVVARPHYFGALMTQYGQADAMVGGNQSVPAVVYRAILHSIKPMPEISKIFGVTALSAPHLEHFGDSGLMFFADTGMIPEPSVEELAMIAVETGRLARHFLGRPPRVAMLSHSTKGTAVTPPAQKVAAAAVLAREKVAAQALDVRIDGELQADVALDPEAAEVKLPGTRFDGADVLVFPNLDAAHISMKLIQHCAGARNFGQILIGMARPVAQVPRTASEETLYGTAAAVAVEAIKFHELYPDGEVG
jgi:phosphotransacetylase